MQEESRRRSFCQSYINYKDYEEMAMNLDHFLHHCQGEWMHQKNGQLGLQAW